MILSSPQLPCQDFRRLTDSPFSSPGPSDPANASLPQQPLHRCLLPSTTCYANVGRVTNPHAFSIDKVKVTGTSGQNVDDILKYVDHDDRLGALASTLEW